MRTRAAGFRIKISAPRQSDTVVDCEIPDADLLVPKFKAAYMMVKKINQTVSGLKKKSPFQIWLYLYPKDTAWYLIGYSLVSMQMEKCLDDEQQKQAF